MHESIGFTLESIGFTIESIGFGQQSWNPEGSSSGFVAQGSLFAV